MKWSTPAAGRNLRIERARLGGRCMGGDGDVGIEPPILLLDSRQVRSGELERRQLP